jgi:hypothetical protein
MWGAVSGERTGLSFTSVAVISNKSAVGLISISVLSESESYITTDGQSASPSWNKGPIWDLRPDFYYCQTVAGLLMWGALSEDWSVVYNCCWSSPTQSFSGPSLLGLVTIFYCQIRDFPFRRLLLLAGQQWTPWKTCPLPKDRCPTVVTPA